eukprot:scaffold197385_cov27-Tisochrysis_lutea.AAC.1
MSALHFAALHAHVAPKLPGTPNLMPKWIGPLKAPNTDFQETLDSLQALKFKGWAMCALQNLLLVQ